MLFIILDSLHSSKCLTGIIKVRTKETNLGLSKRPLQDDKFITPLIVTRGALCVLLRHMSFFGCLLCSCSEQKNRVSSMIPDYDELFSGKLNQIKQHY